MILFIGDGMGVSTVTAARILEGQRRGGAGEEHELAFEQLPYLALAKTYSVTQQTSDSAPTATALFTGIKTRDRSLSVDETVTREVADAAVIAQHSVPTLLEQAAARGLATGFVTTTRVTHATPAALYAHTPNRDWEWDAKLPAGATVPDIATQLVAAQQQVRHRRGAGRRPRGAHARIGARPRVSRPPRRAQGRPRADRCLAGRATALAVRLERRAVPGRGPAQDPSPARPVRAASHAVRARPQRRALAGRDDGESHRDPGSRPAGLPADGRGGPHRPRAPRRQCLPRARRHDRAVRCRAHGAVHDRAPATPWWS